MKDYYVIVIAYEPEIKKLIHMLDLTKQCGCALVVIDNSENNPIPEDLALNFGFILFSLKGNFGVAYAQNIGINYVSNKKGKFVSFFDQDSIFEKDFLLKLYTAIKLNECSIISPLIKDKDTNEEIYNYKLNYFGYPQKKYSRRDTIPTQVDIVISSGLTCTLTTLIKVGLMNEDFFIDYIDTEWCLRCRKHKIPILVMSDIIMYHKIGNLLVEQLGYKTNIHSPSRTYYKIRNIFLFNRCSEVPLLMKLHGLISVYLHAFLQFLNTSNKKCFIWVLFQGTKDGLKKIVGKKDYSNIIKEITLCQ